MTERGNLHANACYVWGNATCKDRMLTMWRFLKAPASQPGGPIHRAGWPGRDWTFWSPTGTSLRSPGFQMFPLVPRWMKWKGKPEKGILGSRYQHYLFALWTSGSHIASIPDTWWKWDPDHFLPSVKKKRVGTMCRKELFCYQPTSKHLGNLEIKMSW